MLYLEDYLELIEHLPQELRDRFTDIRERDLQVHNSSEHLREKVKQFFADATKLKPELAQCDYEKLLGDYQGTMKYADDKVQIAEQMQEIMIKLVQRLDTELEKFKLELEADHAGITEELEKRSLELDADSRFDDLINNHLNQSSSLTAALATPSVSKPPPGIKDRRRSEHKHRHHPYQNNDHDNGYPGRASKLSHNDHGNSFSKSNSIQQTPRNNNTYYNHNNHQLHEGSKSKHHQNVASCRRQPNDTSPTRLLSAGPYSSLSAPASVAGDLNGIETGHYGNNLSSFGNNPGFKSLASKNQLQNPSNGNQLPFGQHHSALSAALSSASNPVPALAMMKPNQVHHTTISNDPKVTNLGDPMIRQDPFAEAASEAIAATQQLQQGRRTSSLKASFAAINAAGLGQVDMLGSKQDALAGSRNALAPMATDQQAFRFGPYGKLNSPNGNASPLYISVTKSGRPSKRPRNHASHLYPDESPKSISSDNSVFENSESLSSTDFIESGTTFGSTSPSSLDFATNASQGNTTLYHRDETKYCVCQQISYGEMVACDNDECEIEWFHYDCVGITQPPKGKWFCPDCTRKMTSHQQNHPNHNLPQTQKKRGRKEKSLFNLVNNSLDSSVRSKDRSVEQPRNIV